ncbi:uncharacterized protein LOC132732839 [Ruditapes philippinarum]|uniref:uncharacterized protein LOC132732839 n=1 Tax=Ruditapes philippinarum TaxID=129788 RepID=UPI00295B37DD|nr:uncharacterized protein LOC132732839 [Ruditapes philippinarum]
MKNKGLKFGKEHEIDLKMMTVGKSDENRKLAENILYTVFQKATSMTDGCDDSQTMKEAVDKILDRIRNMEDVKIKYVEKHCIILTFKSSSATGFLDLIDFTKSEYFFAEIENIGKCLSDHIGEFISVTAFITLESMQQALDILAKNDYGDGESSTHLKLVVSSANAIEKVSRMINDNETENDMNDVAQGISEHLNERISISRSIELEGLGEVFGNPLQCLLHSEWQPFVKSGSRTTHVKFNSSPHLAYLQSLIDDIQRPTEIIYRSLSLMMILT